MWQASDFPLLEQTDYLVTSEKTPEYNCIAWAAGDVNRWWWPDSMEQAYWPQNSPREESLEAFLHVYQSLGYELCENEEHEPTYEKIALFVSTNGIPTHAARQVPNGRWTSKLGREEDIEHSLRSLEGPLYGTVSKVLRRKRPR